MKDDAGIITKIEDDIRRLKGRPDPGGFSPAWARIFGADRHYNNGDIYWPRWTFISTQTGGFELLPQGGGGLFDLIVQVPVPGVYVWSMAFGFQIEWEGTVDPVGTEPYWFAPLFYPYDGFNVDGGIAGDRNDAEWNLSAGGDLPGVMPLKGSSLGTEGRIRKHWRARYTAEVITAGFDNFQGNGNGQQFGISIAPRFWTADWQPWTAEFLWPDTAPNTNRDLMGDSNNTTVTIYQVA